MIRNVSRSYLSLFFIVCPMLSVVFGQSEGERIRSKTIYQYGVESGFVSDIGQRISLTMYDENGQVSEQIKYGQDGRILVREANAYNTEGKLTETVTTSASANISKRMEYTYENGLLVTAVSQNLATNITVIIENRYDDQGRLMETIARSPDSWVYRRMVSTYDAEGRLEKTAVYNNEGQVIGEEILDYEEARNVVIRKLGAGHELTRRFEKKHDQRGNLEEQVELDAHGRIIKRIKNEYDEEGRLVEVVNEMPAANMRTRSRHTFDEQGRLSETIEYNKFDQPVKVLRVVY